MLAGDFVGIHLGDTHDMQIQRGAVDLLYLHLRHPAEAHAESVGVEAIALEFGYATEDDILQAGRGKVKDEVVLAVGLVFFLHVVELPAALGLYLQGSALGGHFHQVEPVGAACQLNFVAVALRVDDFHGVTHIEVGEVAERVGAGGELRPIPIPPCEGGNCYFCK